MKKKRTAVLICLLLIMALALCGAARHFGLPLPGQKRVACVGDSITFGLGTSDWPKHTYPAELGRLLGSAYAVENFGVSGFAAQDSADLPYRAHEYYRRSLEYEPDVVIIMLGSNDAKAVNWQSGEQFKAALAQLVSDYAALESSPEIYLCTPCAPFYPSELNGNFTALHIDPALVEQAAGATRELAKEMGLELIDINSLSKTLPDHFPDCLHPDDEATAAIAKTIFKAITN